MDEHDEKRPRPLPHLRTGALRRVRQPDGWEKPIAQTMCGQDVHVSLTTASLRAVRCMECAAGYFYKLDHPGKDLP
jgi:hypothetical protein